MNKRQIFNKLIAASLLTCFFAGAFPGYAKAAGSNLNQKVLYNKYIAKGINYTEKQVVDHDNGKKNRLNIVTADLNDNDVKVIFSKAKDKEKKAATLTDQIQREIFKGNNVVAGINADFFNMGTGFSTGPQISNGAIISCHEHRSEENIYPVFGIDKNNKPFIDNIHFNGKLTVLNQSDDTIDIDNVNREGYENSLILNTTQLNELNKIDFSNYAENGALTVVKGIKPPIMLGEEYEGVVESVGEGRSSVKIPEDGIVLASHGEKAEWVKAHLKQGDKIKIKLDYDKKDIKDAIGVYTCLVKDGRVLSNDEMVQNGANKSMVLARKSRAAIGITKDNKVIAITADAGNQGISDGVTFAEMAQMLKDMGAVYAAALDGGGSTQMNVKPCGEMDVKVVNSPSYGNQRALSNGILFASNAKRTNKLGSLEVCDDITIFKGSSYKFNLKGMDTNYNFVDLKDAPAKWELEGVSGTVDSKGQFTAGNASSGKVTATLDGIKASANVNVIDSLSSLGIQGSSLNLKKGDKYEFALNASNGLKVIISNSAAKWQVTGNIGTIDKNGCLTVNCEEGNGEVIARAGGKEAKITVNVSEKNGEESGNKYNEDNEAPSIYRFSPDYTIYGDEALISVKIKDNYSGIDANSIKVKLDDSFVDANFDEKTGTISYKAKGLEEGSHTFEAEAQDKAGNKTKEPFQRIFFVSYEKDTTAPAVSFISPLNGTSIKAGLPKISVNIRDTNSGVDLKDISITLDGKSLTPFYDETSGWAYVILDDTLPAGTHTVSVEAKDRKGNKSKQHTSSFNVEAPISPKDPDKFTVSVFSDTQGIDFASLFLKRTLEDESELVIINGDIIDYNELKIWEDELSGMFKVNPKPIMFAPGEFDLSKGNEENLMVEFGCTSPAYSFEYGNSLFISLNSAYENSIGFSDPTQFDYLKKILERNKKPNVFIFTHTPARDSFGLKNGMPEDDAENFENILAEYKKANKDKNINAISGHLHGIDSYENGGVVYTVTGNGNLKRNVSPENGGFLSYTKFNVDGNKVTHKFVPVTENISIVDRGIINGEMAATVGENKKLNLFGDFSSLNANYIIPINGYKDLDVSWESDNPDAVMISPDGVLTAKNPGAANIEAISGGKSYRFKVISSAQNEVKPYKIGINLDSMVLKPGENEKINVNAYDLYGNSYLIDNSLVKFTVPKNIGAINNGVFTASKDVNSEVFGEIKASYKNFDTSVNVKIAKERIYGIVNAQVLNVRDHPATGGGKVIGTLKYGDKVEIVRDMGDWLEICYKDGTYYIAKQYVNIVE